MHLCDPHDCHKATIICHLLPDVLTLDMGCVLREVGAESVHIIWTDVSLQRINVNYFTRQSQINHFTQPECIN